MSCAALRDSIRQEVIGAQQKRIFLVEGTDDVSAWQILLNRFVPDWETRWGIAQAGNKAKLLCLLEIEPDWLGLVDRDEWDQAAIETNTRNRPNLRVLRRFCLENYLIDPDELWPAITAVQQATLAGGQATLATALQTQLDRYLRHGALWIVVSPLWTGLRALGFKEALASEDSLQTAQDDVEIRRILHVSPTAPFRHFSDEPRTIIPGMSCINTYVEPDGLSDENLLIDSQTLRRDRASSAAVDLVVNSGRTMAFMCQAHEEGCPF
ncbi:DUF4435 domain-containing protein [Lamprocystis purpurea]|jgi:hypothetical protein|uniref:DUF4435 domain-containing protein n=1 Tax=Lamprocystis purpurea TaxID=61598 RepID=UPI00035F061E|nr:DUF4435 domain-containing protein [Lamprocystis purpurea]